MSHEGLDNPSRIICYFTIALALHKMVRAVFGQTSAMGSNTPHATSQKEGEDGGYNQLLHDCDKTVADKSEASVFADWVTEAGRLWDNPVAAKDYLSARLLAIILNTALVNMTSHLKATLPHDYIYGIFSIGGNAIYPRKITPDYTQRFEDVFHEYTTLMLEHTGDLAIIPRKYRKLEGVPSWVPDYRTPRAFPFDSLPRDLTVVNSDVSVSDDRRVCFTRGVHLGETKLALDCSRDPGAKEESFTVIDRFDKLLQHICNEGQLDKHDVFAEMVEVFNVHAYLSRFQTGDIQKVYDH